MKTNFSVLFYLKKLKNYIKHSGNLFFLRSTADGVLAERIISRNCEPKQWNAIAGKIIGTKEDIKTLNAYLRNMKAGVYVAMPYLA